MDDKLKDYQEHFLNFRPLSSKIYATLSPFIATQPDMIEMAIQIPMTKSPRTVFLAAVHALLLSGVQHNLARYYPSVGGTFNEENSQELTKEFVHFFYTYKDQIKRYLGRNTQTNEVSRSAPLAPLFCEVSRRVQNKPLSLVEIGTSAGLLLNLDQFQYKIKDTIYGNKNSKLTVESEWTGDFENLFEQNFFNFSQKVGVDLNPLDLEDKETFAWLQALIWPEHTTRLKNLTLARGIFLENEKSCEILKGDFISKSETILNQLRNEAVLVFQCVWVLYQFSKEAREELENKISEIARNSQKKVYFILDEWDIVKNKNYNFLILREYKENGEFSVLAKVKADHHGAWVTQV